jgi:ankyrin repeat protein
MIDGMNLIHSIASSGDIYFARVLIEAGVNLNAIIQSPTMLAAMYQSHVSKPLQERANNALQTLYKNEVPHDSETPLMLAAIYQNEKMVRFLLEQKADPTLCDKYGLDTLGVYIAREPKERDTPLNLRIIMMLLNAGLSINRINTLETKDQGNPLAYCCQGMDLARVTLLVNQFGADPNILLRLQRFFVTPFSKAVIKKDLAVMHYLLNQDIRPLNMSTLKNALEILSMIQGEPNIFINDSYYLNGKEYFMYVEESSNLLKKYRGSFREAIFTNIVKLNLIRAAEKDLAAKEYHSCLNACFAVQATEFKTEQYDERLWETFYQTYLGLADYKNAYDALQCYINILKKKHEQILEPNFKIQLQGKIEKAAESLRETYQKILITDLFIFKREVRIRRKQDNSDKCGGVFGYRHK